MRTELSELSGLTKTYKGYQGSVTFDEGALIVTILHIRDFVSDECTDSTQIQSAFERLVDEYLEDCKAVGKEPDRPFRGTFNVRIDPELHRRAAYAAASKNLSLNDLVGRAIAQLVDHPEEIAPLTSSLHHTIQKSVADGFEQFVSAYIQSRVAEREVHRMVKYEATHAKSSWHLVLHSPRFSPAREVRDWSALIGDKVIIARHQ